MGNTPLSSAEDRYSVQLNFGTEYFLHFSPTGPFHSPVLLCLKHPHHRGLPPTSLRVTVCEARDLRVRFGEPVFVRALFGNSVLSPPVPPFIVWCVCFAVYFCLCMKCRRIIYIICRPTSTMFLFLIGFIGFEPAEHYVSDDRFLGPKQKSPSWSIYNSFVRSHKHDQFV